jgi:hypothetical protein
MDAGTLVYSTAMAPDFRTRLQAILDALDDAIQALHEGDGAVHGDTDALRQRIDAQDRIYAAHTRAIDAALAANRAALDLLNDADQ